MKSDTDIPKSILFGLYVDVIARVAVVWVVASIADCFLWVGGKLTKLAKRCTGVNWDDNCPPKLEPLKTELSKKIKD